MAKKNKKMMIAVALTAALFVGCIGLMYLGVRLDALKQEKKSLLRDFKVIEKELIDLNVTLQDRERQLDRLKEELDGLSHPQRLKQALTAAQGMINTLNSELTNVKAQADILRGENFALKSRVAANTKELDRLVKELQDAKTKIVTLESSQKMALQEERLSWLDVQVKEKDKNIKSLQRDIGQLKNKYGDIVKERDFLKKNIERYQKELASKKPSEVWQGRIEELTRLLKEKEQEKNELLQRFSRLSKEKDDIDVEIEEYKRNIEELKSVNQNLQGQVLELAADLSRKSNEFSLLQKKVEEMPVQLSGESDELAGLKEHVKIQNERLKTVNSLYDRLKDQLKDLAGILYKKDTDLEEKEQQISDLKKEITHIKVESDDLKEAVADSEVSQKQMNERLTQATNLNTILQERLGEVSDLLGDDAAPAAYEQKPVPPVSASDEAATRQKTTDLRKRVEVILESIESGGFSK